LRDVQAGAEHFDPPVELLVDEPGRIVSAVVLGVELGCDFVRRGVSPELLRFAGRCRCERGAVCVGGDLRLAGGLLLGHRQEGPLVDQVPRQCIYLLVELVRQVDGLVARIVGAPGPQMSCPRGVVGGLQLAFEVGDLDEQLVDLRVLLLYRGLPVDAPQALVELARLLDLLNRRDLPAGVGGVGDAPASGPPQLGLDHGQEPTLVPRRPQERVSLTGGVEGNEDAGEEGLGSHGVDPTRDR